MGAPERSRFKLGFRTTVGGFTSVKYISKVICVQFRGLKVSGGGYLPTIKHDLIIAQRSPVRQLPVKLAVRFGHFGSLVAAGESAAANRLVALRIAGGVPPVAGLQDHLRACTVRAITDASWVDFSFGGGQWREGR